MTEVNGQQKTAVLGILKDTLQDLSGLTSDEIEDDATFLELGFDSLFLTQLATGFKKATSVEIAFRQLLTDALTLGELANYVIERNPNIAASAPQSPDTAAEVSAEQAEQAPLQVVAPVNAVPATDQPVESQQAAIIVDAPVINPIEQVSRQASVRHDYGGPGSSGIEVILTEQLRVMEHQLSVLAAIYGSGTVTRTNGYLEKNEVAGNSSGTIPNQPDEATALKTEATAKEADGSASVSYAGKLSKPANTASAGETSTKQADAFACLTKPICGGDFGSVEAGRQDAASFPAREQVAEDPSLSSSEILPLSQTEVSPQPVSTPSDSADVTTAQGTETVTSVFNAIAAQHASEVAIRDVNGNAVTYEQLDQRSDRLAGWLEAQGCETGNHIGLLLPRSVDLVVAMLATLKLGCVYIPVDPAQPISRSQKIFNDADVRVVLHANSDFNAAEWNLPEVRFHNFPSLEFETSLVRKIAGEIHSETPAYVMYTSGSTGEPKGVVVPHRAILNLVLDTNYIAIAPGDVIAHLSNTAFDASTFEIWGALLNGATIAVFAPDEVINPGKFGYLIRKRSITSMFLTTALFNVMANEVPGVFAPVRDVLFGGERADPVAVRSVTENGTPTRLVNVYGPTEATTFSTWFEVGSVASDANSVPIGRPISNTDALILDDLLLPVRDGEVGQLYMAGAGLALGYLNSPVLTAERFVKSPDPSVSGQRMYKTGDLVCTNESGDIEFVGRADSQVKFNGFRIEPGEIETALNRHQGVKANAVIAWPETGDRHLVAYVDVSSSETSSDELVSHLEDLLPRYMIPTQFVFVERLPVNANGKVDRSALPEPKPVDRAGGVRLVTPASAVETQLAAMWEEILEYSPAGIYDSFFEMGGDSLRTATLFARVERLLGSTLPIEEFSANPTIANVASIIKTQSSGSACAVPKLLTLNPDGTVRTLFGADPVYNYISLARHLGSDQPVSGPTPQPLSGERTPSNSVEERAAHLVGEIRKIQPTGPYDLCGHSAAGLVVFEMAQQLAELDEKVENLILFDPSNPNDNASGITRLVSAHLRKARTNGNRGLASYLPKLVTKKFSKSLNGNGGLGRTPDFKSMTRDELLEDLRATEGPMVRRYRPTVYRGNVTLVLVEKPSEPGAVERVTNQWRDLVDGEIRVVTVGGTHNTMLKEPTIGQIAPYVKDALEKRAVAPDQSTSLGVAVGVNNRD